MAHIDFMWPIESGVGSYPTNAPIASFDSLDHVPVVVDGGLPAAVAIEPGTPRRITRGEWNLHQEEIKRQHPLMTLPELRKFMVTKHSFFAR
jgi:hypothetical protein